MSDVTTIEADVPERYADAVSKRLSAAGKWRTSRKASSRSAFWRTVSSCCSGEMSWAVVTAG